MEVFLKAMVLRSGVERGICELRGYVVNFVFIISRVLSTHRCPFHFYLFGLLAEPIVKG